VSPRAVLDMVVKVHASTEDKSDDTKHKNYEELEHESIRI